MRAEALLRWPQPGGGEVAPVVFLPVAESSSLIREIGERVLRFACRQYARWCRDGLPPISMMV